MLRPAVLTPLPRGVVLLAVYSQNGCDDQRETETGIKQSEIGWEFKKGNFGKNGQIFDTKTKFQEVRSLIPRKI